MTRTFPPTSRLTIAAALTALRQRSGVVWSREALRHAEAIAATMVTGGTTTVPQAALDRLSDSLTPATPTDALAVLVGMATVYGLAAGLVTRASLSGLVIEALPGGLSVTVAALAEVAA